jgi:hypothetical protein
MQVHKKAPGGGPGAKCLRGGRQGIARSDVEIISCPPSGCNSLDLAALADHGSGPIANRSNVEHQVL